MVIKEIKMKKVYSKPSIEIEVYELNAAIAANCSETVSFGPEAPGKVTCEEFKDAFEVVWIAPPGASVLTTGGTPFYSDGAANCDCYYTSGGGVYFTS